MTFMTLSGFPSMTSPLALRTQRINDEALLFSTGALDSFYLIDIVTFLEQRTGLKVRPRDLEFGNFDSVSRMVAYVARHG